VRRGIRNVSLLTGATLLVSCAATPVAERPSHPAPSAPMVHPKSPQAEEPPVNVVLSTEPWSFGTIPGMVIRTPNYRIYTTERSQTLRERLPEFLERALAHYRTALGSLPGPTIRLDTYLMDTRPQWVALSKRLSGSNEGPHDVIGRGGYASRGIGVFYDIGLYDTLAIAAHEGWHQYTQRTFKDPLPVWLEEGLATYMEGHKWDGDRAVFQPWANIERFDQLRKAHSAGALMPFPSLLEASPQELAAGGDGSELTYYAQVWALVHYLQEGDGRRHRAGLRSLLSDAAAGRARVALAERHGRTEAVRLLTTRHGAEMLSLYCDTDAVTIGVGYDRFVDSIVHPGARNRITAGRSPLD
jgi:hypothetical protein